MDMKKFAPRHTAVIVAEFPYPIRAAVEPAFSPVTLTSHHGMRATNWTRPGSGSPSSSVGESKTGR